VTMTKGANLVLTGVCAGLFVLLLLADPAGAQEVLRPPQPSDAATPVSVVIMNLVVGVLLAALVIFAGGVFPSKRGHQD
jgi:hypothetical protein